MRGNVEGQKRSMGRKSDEPICKQCGEDSRDMVERCEYKREISYYCKVCSMTWSEKRKASGE